MLAWIRLSQVLGRSPGAIRLQAAARGWYIPPVRRRSHWTPAEDAQMLRLLQDHSKREVAALMGMRLDQVQNRTERLKIPARDRLGYYTQDEISKLFGVSDRWVARRIEWGQLSGQKWTLKDYGIPQEAVRDFVRRYPFELQGKPVDMVGLVELLVGVVVPL